MKLTTENISARLDSTEVCATLSNPLADSLDYWAIGPPAARALDISSGVANGQHGQAAGRRTTMSFLT